MSAKAMTKETAPRVLSTHHSAYRCFDAEETRKFWEDIMGLELAAALSFDHISGTDTKLDYMHLFFKLGDGNFVAFFDVPDHMRPDLFKRRSGLYHHIAMEVATEAELEAFEKRWRDAGLEVTSDLDHSFVRSIYTYDPNGIQTEILWKAPSYKAILSQATADVPRSMRDWTEKTRAKKEAYRKQHAAHA
ncbi:MAG: VOC family protein [Gammaproteobacteria bacterium]|nr:VOC family protein [Gammaproteobacteria bacterium]